MTPLTFALVLTAALCHATWNLLSKRAAEAGTSFLVASGAVACLVYGPWALWSMLGGVDWSPMLVAAVVASAVIHLAYSLCLQQGYRVADFSVVYPVARGTGPLIASLCAFALLGEEATPAGLAGLVAVVGGIVLISTRGDLAAFARPGGRTGVAWGGATGGLIAAYTVVDGYAVKHLGVAPVVLDWLANLLRLLMLAPAVLRDPAGARARMRGHWIRAVAVGVLSPLGYILVLIALAEGAPLSIVAPLREMSMMLGAVFAMVFLRERVGPWRLLGCAVLAGGVALLANA